MKAYRLVAPSAVAAFVLLAVSSACGSSSSGSPGGGDDDGGDASLNGNEAGNGRDGTVGDEIRIVPPPDGASDAATDAMEVVEAGDSGVTLDCNEAIDTTQVFVSAAAGSFPSGPCLPSSPCTTIGAALAAAATSHATEVYIDEGTYTEQVTIPAGITRIRGGWKFSAGGSWTIDCSSARFTSTTITAPASVNKTVIAQDLPAPVSLETLVIKSKATANASESLYGVFATGTSTSLTLIDTTVITTAGGNGAPGSAGGAGAAGGTGCAAGTASAATPGTAPGVAANVTYGPSGAIVTSGLSGTAGGNGGNGAAGMPSCADTYDFCDGDPPEYCPSPPPPPAGMVCAAGGAPGCGGGPGAPGAGGGGGGSSIALYAWDATVVVKGGALQPGNGGTGGGGGAGGASGQPSAGTAGAAAGGTGLPCTERTIKGMQVCGGRAFTVTGMGGGPGANGAVGPGGGGGAGGDSYAYYQNNNNVNKGSANIGGASAGAGGAGAGTPAAPAGPAGQAPADGHNG